MNKAVAEKKSFAGVITNAPYFLWAAIFIVVPLFVVVYYAFTDDTGAFTWGNITDLGDYADTFLISVLYSVIATVITLVIAYPFAYFLSKCKASSQKIQMMLVMLPMWMSLLIRTYSLTQLIESNGIINSIITSWGLEPLEMINTPGAVIMGMVYNYLPYMILPIYTAISKIHPSLLEAAEDLGCNGFNKIRRLVMPMSMPGVVSGIIMVFVPSVSTFYISQKLGGTIRLVGDVIETQMKNSKYHIGASMSLVLMVFILISLAIMNKFSDDDGGMIV
ncbi:MAG: ABC transporter permease [Ruminococcaceae bacterium]|nr:ABC transporter permease [Oscillospiraceae bacterium]